MSSTKLLRSRFSGVGPFHNCRCIVEYEKYDARLCNIKYTSSNILAMIFPQWIASIGVTLLIMQMGLMSGCVSPMLIQLTSPNSPILISKSEGSWVASLANIGRFIGAISGSLVTTYFGPKRSICATSLPISLGWLSIASANSVEVLYAGRVLVGIGVGMAYSCFPLYLGEVAMPEHRGAMMSLASFGAPSGQVIASIASNYFGVIRSSRIYLGLSILLMALFTVLPESPHHLVKVGNRKAAKKSISWYRSGKNVEEEFDAVLKFVALEEDIKFIIRLKEFQDPSIRRATYHVIILFGFMQVCGLSSIVLYLETILRQAKCFVIDPAQIVIYINVCAALATLLSMFLIDKYGRRFLFALSSAGVTISMFGIMCHFLLLDMDYEPENLQWLPILSLVSFMLFFFIGFFPVPNAMTSEIIPPNVKPIVSCLGSLTSAIVAFLSSKTYQPMVNIIGEAYVFLIYALLSSAALPYTLFAMPETKGKTLQKIQEELMKNELSRQDPAAELQALKGKNY